MCGIVGLVSSYNNGFSYNEASMFEAMLFYDTLRGWDSTGIFGVERDNTVHVVKDAIHGPDFLQTSEWKDAKVDMVARGKILVGHNRAATRGSVVDKNAHPFDIDNKIFLVQNGTYNGSHHHLKNTEVDTEAIAHVIAENEDLETALQKIDAAYALVWYNRDKQQLNLIRNTQRPLFIAYPKQGSGLFFASEAETIIMAAVRNKIELREEPYPLKEYYHYCLEFDSSGNWKSVGKDVDGRFRGTPQAVQVMGKYGHFSHRVSSHDYSEWENYIAERYPNGVQQAKRNQRALQDDNIDEITPSVARAVITNSKEDLINSFIDEVVNPKRRHVFKDYFVDEDECLASMEYTRGLNDKKVHVEVMDYHAGNNRSDCTVWWVWGVIIDPQRNGEPIEMIRWLDRGLDKEAMLEKYGSTGSFVTGRLGGCHSTSFTNNQGKKWLVTCWLDNPEIVSYASHETQ